MASAGASTTHAHPTRGVGRRERSAPDPIIAASADMAEFCSPTRRLAIAYPSLSIACWT